MFERQQVVAGGDARAAVTDEMTRRDGAEHLAPVVAQLLGRTEDAVIVEVGLIEMIGGAGNVAGGSVDRLSLAAEALGRARVDESPVRVAQQRADLRRVGRHLHARRANESLSLARLDASRGGPAFRDPLLESTIEDRGRVVPEPAQHPPEAARVYAVVLIVSDDLHAARDAELAECVCKCLRIGQGVASIRPGYGTREIATQVCVLGTRNVQVHVFPLA